MKKADMAIIRQLFEKILSDFRNDTGKCKDGSPICRATRIQESVQKGIDICNKYLDKMQP